MGGRAPKALLLALACCACAEPAPSNVVIVLVDTLRADRLGAYGYERNTSPQLDALAAESVLFEQARSQAPCTYPSVNSLLTSRRAVRFAGDALRFAIPEDFVSVAEALQERGWRTAAVSASPIVRRTPTVFNPLGGFDRGFEVFDERCEMRDAGCVNRVALDLLDRLEEPFLLYLHYMDPHNPYQPPAIHERRFATAFDGPAWVAAGRVRRLTNMLYGDGPPVSVDDASLQHLVDLYDDEIRYFDGRLGELLAALDGRGLADRTLLVLLSDHGEELLEHADVAHCRNLYDTQIHTPLLLRIPGRAGTRIAEPVENLDVVPTLLEYLEVDADDLGFEGRSLRPLIEGSGSGTPAFAAWEDLRAVVAGRHKLILERQRDRVVLYDLENDPAEKRSIAAERPEEVVRLRRLLDARFAGGAGPKEMQAITDRLRALGYLD